MSEINNNNNDGAKMDTIEYAGKKITLVQGAYRDTRISNLNLLDGYFAQGFDEEGNEYEIFWPEDSDLDGESESPEEYWKRYQVSKI